MVAAGKGLDPFCPYRAKRDALLSYWFLCGTFYQYRAVAGKSQGRECGQILFNYFPVFVPTRAIILERRRVGNEIDLAAR
jgi:hypothetical protein